MSELAKTTERAKPELTTIGKRQVISTGHWNHTIIADYVLLHGRTRWITTGELASVAWGQNMPTNKQRVRRNLSKLWDYILINHGCLMVTEYGPPRSRAQAVKMYDPTSEQERQSITSKLNKLANRGELSAERYDLALSILRPETKATDVT
jgi:hypothetical protein